AGVAVALHASGADALAGAHDDHLVGFDHQLESSSSLHHSALARSRSRRVLSARRLPTSDTGARHGSTADPTLGAFGSPYEDLTIGLTKFLQRPRAAMSNQVKHFEFGPFQLVPSERVLMRDGERVPLAPKAFETLLTLVERSGHVVD